MEGGSRWETESTENVPSSGLRPWAFFLANKAATHASPPPGTAGYGAIPHSPLSLSTETEKISMKTIISGQFRMKRGRQ